MGRADFYRAGDWNAKCDECGSKYKASQLRKRWDNAMVCQECWEPRHPQDFVRGVPDASALPWSRPDPPPIFVTVDFGQSARLIDASRLGTLTMG